MKPCITLELDPFPVPMFVYIKQTPGMRSDGFQATPAHKYKLTELDDSTLDLLIEDFKRSVYAQAGRY